MPSDVLWYVAPSERASRIVRVSFAMQWAVCCFSFQSFVTGAIARTSHTTLPVPTHYLYVTRRCPRTRWIWLVVEMAAPCAYMARFFAAIAYAQATEVVCLGGVVDAVLHHSFSLGLPQIRTFAFNSMSSVHVLVADTCL
jgi:hypothetical protein